jgi:hypothetical protein
LIKPRHKKKVKQKDSLYQDDVGDTMVKIDKTTQERDTTKRQQTRRVLSVGW